VTSPGQTSERSRIHVHACPVLQGLQPQESQSYASGASELPPAPTGSSSLVVKLQHGQHCAPSA
jgi:hypothetical protein